ncbi:CNGA4 protein, partial [Alcedo cyanopectus]|nr:CNGA4 protein [Ceyx cyanopectus]
AFLEDGLLVRERSRIRRRYLRSRAFLWDVASTAPLDLALGTPGSPALRANRCLRAPRLREAFERWETRSATPGAPRLARLLLLAFATLHSYGCLHFALAPPPAAGRDPPLRQYLRSLHLATLVLATVGDVPTPQRVSEMLFLTAGFLLAVLGFATLSGSVSSVLSDAQAARAALCPDPQPLRGYLRARGLGGRLERRVSRWHRHLRARRKPPAESGALRHLPRGLRDEVTADVHLPALLRVPLFQGWPRGLLCQLVPRLRPQVFGPGEFVCRRGDVGREMYFVREGRLAVLAEDGITRLALLGPGLYFGEISLINIKGNTSGNRRTANVLSIGYSELFCLAKEDLAQVLSEFPAARATLQARGRRLLRDMGKLDAGAEAAAEEAERRVRAAEEALEGLRGKGAMLLAQLEAGALRMETRLQRLE